MAAKKKPVTTLTLADAGIDPDEVGLANAWSLVSERAQPKPPKCGGEKVEDEGDGGSKIAAFLVAPEADLNLPRRVGDLRTMAEVLVLVDHIDGEIRKTTLELLTAARDAGRAVRGRRRAGGHRREAGGRAARATAPRRSTSPRPTRPTS